MKQKTLRRLYRREAAIMLALAGLAVRFLAPARVFAWADRPMRHINRFASDDVTWIAWAVEDVGAKSWLRALCLTRALAAHAMLRRRGIASRLCLGVSRKTDALAAHAWVEVGNRKIVGGPEAEGLTPLAGFGALSS